MPRHCLGQILVLNVPHMLRKLIHWSLATLTTVLMVSLGVGEDVNEPTLSFTVQPSLNFDGFPRRFDLNLFHHLVWFLCDEWTQSAT